MKRFLVPIALAAISVTAAAQSPTPVTRDVFPETVSVTGTGRVSLVPDRFTFNVGVQTMAPTVDAAVNENNERVARVIAALKGAGAAADEIRTSGFSIYPQQDYQQGQAPRLLGYQVNNSITVRRKDVSSASKLLQVAISAGVNTASGLNFEVSDPTRGRDQGMKAAFDDAKAKAALLAQAAGRTLGRAMTITEGTEAAPPPRPMPVRAMAARAEVSEVPVEAGSQELSFTVSVTFELR